MSFRHTTRHERRDWSQSKTRSKAPGTGLGTTILAPASERLRTTHCTGIPLRQIICAPFSVFVRGDLRRSIIYCAVVDGSRACWWVHLPPLARLEPYCYPYKYDLDNLGLLNINAQLKRLLRHGLWKVWWLDVASFSGVGGLVCASLPVGMSRDVGAAARITNMVSLLSVEMEVRVC